MENQKYEFKDIKDVDLSKLEDDETYIAKDINGVKCLWFGHYIKEESSHLKSIQFPCKAVEVSAEEIEEEAERFSLERRNKYAFMEEYCAGAKDGFEEGVKWRDKQSITPSIEWNDNMIQGSNDKRFEILDKSADNANLAGYQLAYRNAAEKALTEYSNLCQKALFKALQIKAFVAPSVKEKCVEFAEWIKFNAKYCEPDGWKDENGLGETKTTKQLFNQFIEGEGKQ